MLTINPVTSYSNIDGVGVITLNSPPVNALSAAVRDGIHAAALAAIADPAAHAIVLLCEGRTFIAGADIAAFGKPPTGVSLPEVQRVLEDSPKPVVAAIHGTALGGGLEVALVCHYRIAVPSARLGLPEVHLGLLPGAGGTQRLPRIVGPEAALQMMTSGVHMPAAEALHNGLLDALAPEGQLRATAIAFAQQVVAEKRPLRKIREQNDKVQAARGQPELFTRFRQSHAKQFRGFDAPEKIIQCVEAAVNLPFDEGLQRERQLFTGLVQGQQSAAQRNHFFASRQAWNIPGLAQDAATLPVQTVGIIGAGTMGAGIAMNFLNAGLPVHLVETGQEALDRGLRTIRSNYENTARKGRITPQAIEQRMALLSSSLDLQDLAQVDLVIEAVFENMAVKKELFARLDGICKPAAILASNTSALDLNEIASATARPESVIGLHFFSPANVMKLLEVVRGARTSDAVIATAMQLARKIGKVAVLVGVCPGFVGNRILAQRQREANQLILEGAMPWAVDRVLYDFGFPMGPFAMSDLAGLDLGWNKEKSSSSTLREVLCEMDRRGQKTGAGFYDYDEKRTAIPSPLVEKAIQDFARQRGVQAREVSDEEILERCIYPMINEGAKILEEGMALRASDIDVVWVNGYGWPVYHGGPMFYGERIGLPKVLAKMQEFEARWGPQFKPAKLLQELVASGRTFSDLQPAG
ncbi:3-hydroxyacyl-CoA dehydrogenase NAD-binding domain-containing protein [Acidovorax sp. Be4]|uniref:3-hydroxyacyl-CoA dehydrogenase NAD-binding domain-containing protein n=1 Tax=Acidovorax bellezanensis TaxID=2976702 RepID=A0ABT2PQ16_9BURK|nr:3-hydroxyacyl-CoA dehydrogenase NAD-binding domain-containing protein [Acidovorax sp. Be4]MCT9811367.1 3-hydroxyacyl-CoA dehydrogenase NAD-binding domain-containing protein [Acidovorax sp. Be4]